MRLTALALGGIIAVGLVAVGAGILATPAGGPDGEQPFVPKAPVPEEWPGVGWVELRPAVLAGPGLEQLYGFAGAGERTIMVGESVRGDAPVPVGVAWTSNNPADWRLHDLETLPGAAAPQWAEQAVIGPGGYAVMLLDGTGSTRGIVTSLDGDLWHAAAIPGRGRTMFRLVGGAGGYVAFGTDRDRSVLWVSADGQMWREQAAPAVPGGVLQVNGLASWGTGFLLYGRIRAGDDDGVIWYTTDFETWQRLGADHVGFATDDVDESIERVVPWAGGLFAIGGSGVVDECGAAGRLASADNNPRVAETCPGLPFRQWLSADGERWRQVDLVAADAFGRVDDHQVDSGLLGVAPGLSGLVTIMVEGDVDNGPWRHGLWTTADGLTWVRVGDGPPADAGGPTIVSFVSGRILTTGLANGPGGGDIALWVGTPAE